MDILHEIAARIDKIRDIFQHTAAVFAGREDLELPIAELENTENEFRSVAYEAAAMAMALKDIANNNHSLSNWRLFMEGPAGTHHRAQIHVGLGWALAQQRMPVLPFIESLDPIMRFRVLDGYGYYDGIFRQRKAIANGIVPGEIDNLLLPGYDQGIGRSLWYSCRGQCEKVSGTIAAFPSSRHEDLWRGIGIACAYVGGYDETLLKELLTRSSDYHIQLPVGAALVSRTRSDANALTSDTELACLIWCNLSAAEAMKITVKTEQLIDRQANNAYMTWLSRIREELAARIN